MWINAKIRSDGIGIPVGSKVLMAPSPIQHTADLGKCWAVFDGEVVRQISETFGGRELYSLVTKGKPFSDQERAERKIRPFLAKIEAQMRKNTGFSSKRPKIVQK
jgi:hypothetical protein